MNHTQPHPQTILLQLLSITAKEAGHLEAVTDRLFAILPDNEKQLQEKLNDPQLIDTLEYIENYNELLEAIKLARQFVIELINTYNVRAILIITGQVFE